MKARDLMTRDPRGCEPDHDLTCALRIMKEEDCGVVPVTRGNGQARVVGVVTDRDIALHLGDRDAKPSSVRVQEVMKTDLVACSPEDDDRDVSRRMQEAQVRRVLVVESGRLVGVISTADLARATGAGPRVGEEVKRVMVEISQKKE